MSKKRQIFGKILYATQARARFVAPSAVHENKSALGMLRAPQSGAGDSPKTSGVFHSKPAEVMETPVQRDGLNAVHDRVRRGSPSVKLRANRDLRDGFQAVGPSRWREICDQALFYENQPTFTNLMNESFTRCRRLILVLATLLVGTCLPVGSADAQELTGPVGAPSTREFPNSRVLPIPTPPFSGNITPNLIR